jgi:hypothetical protein
MGSKFTFEERIIQELLILMTEDEFIVDLEEVRRKLGFPVTDDERDEDGSAQHLPHIQDDLIEEVKLFRIRHGLSEAYQMALVFYVQEGHLEGSLESDQWYLNPYMYPTESRNCITLRIYAETTFEDIKSRWPVIAEAQESLKNRNFSIKRRKPTLVRDLHIYRLSKAGKNNTDIAREINKVYKTRLGYEDVINIINRLKKRSKGTSAKKS